MPDLRSIWQKNAERVDGVLAQAKAQHVSRSKPNNVLASMIQKLKGMASNFLFDEENSSATTPVGSGEIADDEADEKEEVWPDIADAPSADDERR